MLGYAISKLRFGLAISFLLGNACAAIPLGTPRDASILELGTTRNEVLLSNTTTLVTARGRPSIFGGTAVEGAHRVGKGEGKESAFRVGVNSGFNGAFGGFERAVDLRNGTRAWGTVGYMGVLGGLDAFTGSYFPLHTYVNGYVGLISGRVAGTFRPEINVKATLQSGTVTFDPYGLGVATVEPRLRWAGKKFHFYAGLGLAAGYVVCGNCVSAQERDGNPVFGIYPLLGVSLP